MTAPADLSPIGKQKGIESPFSECGILFSSSKISEQAKEKKAVAIVFKLVYEFNLFGKNVE